MTTIPDTPSGSQSSAAANASSQQQNASNAANTGSQQRNTPANTASPVIMEIQDPHDIVDHVAAAQNLINTVDRLGQENLDAEARDLPRQFVVAHQNSIQTRRNVPNPEEQGLVAIKYFQSVGFNLPGNMRLGTTT